MAWPKQMKTNEAYYSPSMDIIVCVQSNSDNRTIIDNGSFLTLLINGQNYYLVKIGEL